jgi:hypothetical protein
MVCAKSRLLCPPVQKTQARYFGLKKNQQGPKDPADFSFSDAAAN